MYVEYVGIMFYRYIKFIDINSGNQKLIKLYGHSSSDSFVCKYLELNNNKKKAVRVKYYYIIIDATICLFKVSGMNFFAMS